MLFRELPGDTLVSVKQYYRLAVKTGSIALQKKKFLRSHYLLCCFFMSKLLQPENMYQIYER